MPALKASDRIHPSDYLPRDLRRRLREIAAAEQCKVHDLILEGVRSWSTGEQSLRSPLEDCRRSPTLGVAPGTGQGAPLESRLWRIPPIRRPLLGSASGRERRNTCLQFIDELKLSGTDVSLHV